MAIDLTGISSVNEFYTEHYLATYFEQSVRDAIQAWKESARDSEARTPYQKLRDAARIFDRTYRHEQRRVSFEDARELVMAYLSALGYPEPKADCIELPTGVIVPLFAEYLDEKDKPRVWVIACHPENDEDLLTTAPLVFSTSDGGTSCEISCEDALDILLLDVSNPARFVILASTTELVLVDRNKWPEKRYLSFDVEEVFRRREESTFQAMATLLAYTSLCPAEGETLIDELDRQAREHASEVSDSLRYALRECVELLGNEVVYDWTHNKAHDLDAEPIDAGELTIECLRYMYRMLFLLFMEARPELGFAPTKSEVYLKSYSLESIRALAEGHREGIDAMADDTDYIDRTLRIACDIVYDGYPTSDAEFRRLQDIESTNDVFLVPPLKAHIFDKQRTPLIDNARLRDSVMLQIIDRMSYTHPAKGRSERVSYGTLGINQLGGVYEALLSYRGFIANEQLYEVKRAKDKFDELDVGYFVTESELDAYAEDERVRYESGPRKGELRTYEKGCFIYRLAGREREQSASYYTPESLTQCLVKYALKELLKDKSADEILQLTICEPAMGSAAFLNEAVNQLAEAYLERKQQELGQAISSDKRQLQLQRVKMFIADRNVYGIDLNPIAVELGEVSLWLNTISQDGYVPWFGNQLHCGNSLIGARRQGYTERDLTSKAKGIRWYDHEPERVGFETGCSKSHRVYHFLVGDPGMADYRDRVIKGLEPSAIAKIASWRKAFTQPYKTDEVKSLRELSYVIDGLWNKQVAQQRELRRQTIDELQCFGHSETGRSSRTSIRQKDRVLSEFYRSEHARNAGPYARLKFAMDYWCALWFWPIDKADLLPTRDLFDLEMRMILEGATPTDNSFAHMSSGQMRMDLGDELNSGEQLAVRMVQDVAGVGGVVDLDELCTLFPRLELVRQIANEQHFFHWELEFADVFEGRGGFDLLLGNPPWIKLEWNEKDVLSDNDPRFAVHSPSAAETARLRGAALQNSAAFAIYLDQYVRMTGQKAFLNAMQNYPLLKGLQCDLFRCFIPTTWNNLSQAGISALIHPDSILIDSSDSNLRLSMYRRYLYYFHFTNGKRIFSSNDSKLVFTLNVYSNRTDAIDFSAIWYCTDPSEIDEVMSEADGESNHRMTPTSLRVIKVDKDVLSSFAVLTGSLRSESTRIVNIRNQALMDVILKMGDTEHSLREAPNGITTSECWHETQSRKAGYIRDRIGFPSSSDETIYAGAQIGVANPVFQVVDRVHNSNASYSIVDLSEIDSGYRIRTKYYRQCGLEVYCAKLPSTSWGEPFTRYYRLANREMGRCTNERTLQAAILAPGQTWVNTIFGWCVPMSGHMGKHQQFPAYGGKLLALMAGCYASIPYDYFVRANGKGHVNYATTMSFPVPDSPLNDEIACRALLLNCLTRDYADLWRDVWQPEFATYSWAKDDPRLPASTFSSLTDEWCWETPLRKDYERRQALIELDVLVSLALGLTLEQLITVYELDFSVLQSYERETWYDVNGRVVCSRKAMGNFKYKPTEFKKAFGDIDACTSGVYPKTYIDDTLPGGSVERTIEYVAPFDTCDRVEDYRTTWEFFSKKYGLAEE